MICAIKMITPTKNIIPRMTPIRVNMIYPYFERQKYNKR